MEDVYYMYDTTNYHKLILLFCIFLIASCEMPGVIYQKFPNISRSRYINGTEGVFENEFPKMTQSRYMTESETSYAISNDICKFIDDFSVDTPVEYAVTKDMKMGAVLVDEIVYNQTGNAYKLNNYKWIRVRERLLFLRIDFTALQCDFTT